MDTLIIITIIITISTLASASQGEVAGQGSQECADNRIRVDWFVQWDGFEFDSGWFNSSNINLYKLYRDKRSQKTHRI